MFHGAGVNDLSCHCGSSVLIRGYLPRNFLGIRIQCFHCGEITTTPDLPLEEILPRSAIAIEPSQRPMVTTAEVAQGTILACRDAIDLKYGLTRPVSPPDEPFVLSRETLEAAVMDYDRLTGGSFAAHAAASPPAIDADQGTYPFAWAALRLRALIDQPGWSWLYQDDDAMAAMYVAAVHHLMLCWGHHPLLPRLAAPLIEADRFLLTTATLAMAKLLFETGNRVGFSLSGDEVGLKFTSVTDEPLSLAVLSPEALRWRQKHRRSHEVFRTAVIDAIASAQAKVNRSKPGLIVLAASILQPDFDQMVVDAIHSAFQSAGRKHRGVAAVAIMMPKVLPAGQPDRLGFGYAFYPIRNPRFAGENPIRLT